jgi:hypothetical protein
VAGTAMTPEQRLDRIERIAKLFVTAGLRARRNMRQLDENIGILVNLQIQNEERFKNQDEKINILIDFQRANEERFKANEERFKANEERFAQLVESQSKTDRRLEGLIEIIRNARNGNA